MEPMTSQARETKSTATRTYHAVIDHGSGGETDIVAPTREVAFRLATEWVRSGDWGEVDHTVYARLSLSVRGGPARDSWVRIDPQEPECTSPSGHDWIEGQAYGDGGGVKGTDTCSRCATLRQWTTWANRDTTEEGATGEQGVGSIYYEVE